jgi:2-phosphoglycerate kinase
MKKYNIDKWGLTKETNTLYITGTSGSGKSTLALNMGEGCEIIHLDAIFEEGASSVMNEHLAEYLDSRIFNWSDLRDHQILKSDYKVYYDLSDKVLNAIIKFSEECFNKGIRVIVEGIQIFSGATYVDKMFFKDKPVIILTTNYLLAVYRAKIRDNTDIGKVIESIKYYKYFHSELMLFNKILRGEYYSNCIIEAIKVKLSNPKGIKITYLPRRLSTGMTCHVMWSDSYYDYDFGIDRDDLKWYEYILYKGYIHQRGLGFNESYKAKKIAEMSNHTKRS